MLDSKDKMSHYDYIKYIALSWINPEQYCPKKFKKPKNRKVLVETFTIKRGKEWWHLMSVLVQAQVQKRRIQ